MQIPHQSRLSPSIHPPKSLFKTTEDAIKEAIFNSPSPPIIHMVINYNLSSLPIEQYINRISYTSNMIVSFFRAASSGGPLLHEHGSLTGTLDGSLTANELVSVLREHEQSVPRELEALVVQEGGGNNRGVRRSLF